MATPRKGGTGDEQGNDVPIARVVDRPDDDRSRRDDDVAVVIGQLVPAPALPAYAVSATSRATPDRTPWAATSRGPSSSPSYAAPVMHNSTGSFSVAGTSTSGGARSGGLRRGSSGGPVAGGKARGGGVEEDSASAAAAGGEGTYMPVMTHTGMHNVPGCGIASSTGGRRFGEGAPATTAAARGAPFALEGGGGSLPMKDGDYVADGGPVLVACGQGKSMYKVKGCISSWVLVGGGGGEQPDAVKEKMAAAAGGGAGEGGGGGAPSNQSWALRSEDNPAGDGGVMCSACVPSIASGQSSGTLITGGKDSVLREWEIAEGRPRLVAHISGHTDWISCCALVPSATAGVAPSVVVSGGRDASVRFWHKSAAAAAEAAAARAASDALTKESAGGGGGEGGGPVPPGDGGWSLASSVATAHGSSEFVTCCASPGGSSGAAAGWVATGGTDWSVRLWDVVKSRELGRLSFMGHSHQVRSLACSSDGNLLVSGGDDHKVIVWSPQSRRVVATLKSHASAVHGVAVDPGTHSGDAPRWIASGGGEGFLLVWDPRNFGSPVATLRGEVAAASAAAAPSSLSGAFSSGVSVVEREGSLQGGLAGARSRGESGRWEGETAGATMLNAVNCLAAGGAGSCGDWLFAAGETVVRSWRRRDGIWHGGAGLPGEGLGGIASLSVIE
ncbi:unnamed protein product [Ectocarpus sp. CCAP 1310/34]|nr:unnamed protein product [Ectocarpus sp. CCAP 1310/34]